MLTAQQYQIMGHTGKRNT